MGKNGVDETVQNLQAQYSTRSQNRNKMSSMKKMRYLEIEQINNSDRNPTVYYLDMPFKSKV